MLQTVQNKIQINVIIIKDKFVTATLAILRFQKLQLFAFLKYYFVFNYITFKL